MFVIFGELDTASASHAEAILAFLTSPAMLVEEQGPVQAAHLVIAAIEPGPGDDKA